MPRPFGYQSVERIDANTLRVTARSAFAPFTIRTRDFSITEPQWNAFARGDFIQNAMPHLSASDREFILSGATDEEWDTLKEEED